MEDSVKKFIGDMIDRAKVEAGKLAEAYEAEGQITLPHILAEGEWSNSKGETFGVAIVLNQSQSDIGRLLGKTSLQLYTLYDEKFVTNDYNAGMFSPFDDTVSSEDFRAETESYMEKLISDDGKWMRARIATEGTFNTTSFIVPEIVQMELRKLQSDCTLSVSGVVLEGIDAIKDYVRTQTDSSKPYIIELSQRFPCFDAEDYATEWRFYRNYFIYSSKQEADMNAKKMTQLKEGCNYCFANGNLPAAMRPMVYYCDQSTSMVLAF